MKKDPSMGSTRPLFVSRASNAFSSLAVTVAMAVLTILALALGAVQDTKAESNSGSRLLGVTKVEDPTLEWSQFAMVSLPERSAAEEKPVVISRKPLSSPRSTFADPRKAKGPAQEWMGMSKLAIPLLVGDLVGGPAMRAPTVMTGQAVGVVK
ncbi:MAG: hypothetical protein ACKOB1_11360 [Planctomycetia bacterium]